MKYLLYVLTILIAPSMLYASSVFYPSVAEHIFLDQQKDNEDSFQVLVELEDGSLYRMDTVSFTSTRYQLYEDIARLVNEHRNFKGFDDEDVAKVIWGISPFTISDITDIKTEFDEEELAVFIYFETGDRVRKQVDLTKEFSSSVEVTNFVVDTINSISELDGTITKEQVETLHEEEYTGLSYFAPSIENIILSYNSSENVFDVSLVFTEEQDEPREFLLEYQNTKTKIIDELTETINEQYVQYEDAQFTTNEISNEVSWQGVPWMIDDIEEITYQASDDAVVTIEYTIRTRLSSGLVGVSVLSTGNEVDVDDIDAVSLEATRLLEENQLFAPGFDLDMVKAKILETKGAIEEYENQQEETDDANEEGETTNENSSTSTEAIGTDSLSDDALYQLALQILINYVIANGLDVDVSALQD